MATGAKKRTLVKKTKRPATLKQMGIMPYMRQLDFFDPIVHKPKITMIGAGGIGSWVTFQLAKLGIQDITVIDHDRVAPHNLSTTPYFPTDMGKHKVRALQPVVAPHGCKITPIAKKYEGGKFPPTDILISGVDSMDGRRLLFAEAVKQKIPFFIDGRIGGENLRIYAIQPGKPKDRALYKATLVPNSRVSPLPCTGQQVIDVGWMTASYITRAVRQWVVFKKYTPEIIKKVDTLEMIVADPILPKLTAAQKRARARVERLMHIMQRIGAPDAPPSQHGAGPRRADAGKN